MNIRTLTRRGAVVASIGAALLFAIAPAASATDLPQHVDLVMTFDGLLPGEPHTQTQTFTLPVRAQVSDVVLAADGSAGDVDWKAQLCPGTGPCVDLSSPAAKGVILSPGAQTLRVTATAVTLAPGRSSTLSGRITMLGLDSLAMTGSDGTVPTLMAALALVALGLRLVLLARRRRDDADSGQEAGARC